MVDLSIAIGSGVGLVTESRFRELNLGMAIVCDIGMSWRHWYDDRNGYAACLGISRLSCLGALLAAQTGEGA